MDDKEDTFGWPHMDSCQLKYGGNRCTCGLLATNPDPLPDVRKRMANMASVDSGTPADVPEKLDSAPFSGGSEHG